MADRPLRREGDAEELVQVPARTGTGWTVTKEQLAAAERTRDYHLRRLQDTLRRGQLAQQATRSEF